MFPGDFHGVRLLVASCDRYADVWPGFWGCFRKFWPDFPFQISMITNERVCQDAPEGTRNIRVGTDKGWCKNLATALKDVTDPNIFLFQEDFYLRQPVPTADVLMATYWFIQQARYPVLYFSRRWPVRTPLHPGAFWGECDHEGRPRMDLLPGIFKRDALVDLLDWLEQQIALRGISRVSQGGDQEGLSPGFPIEFETGGSEWMMVRGLKSLDLSSERGAIHRANATYRGQWARDIMDIQAKTGVAFDLKARPVQQ